jgi:hypothetical protein
MTASALNDFASADTRTEISTTAASTERRWSPGIEAPATGFGFTAGDSTHRSQA